MKLPIQAPAVVRETYSWQARRTGQQHDDILPAEVSCAVDYVCKEDEASGTINSSGPNYGACCDNGYGAADGSCLDHGGIESKTCHEILPRQRTSHPDT